MGDVPFLLVLVAGLDCATVGADEEGKMELEGRWVLEDAFRGEGG